MDSTTAKTAHFEVTDRLRPSHRRLRKYPRRRNLQVERLEDRALLDGAAPVVGFRLGIADPATLQPLTEVQAGDQFALVAFVQDLRPAAKGVYSAYLDINFPASQFDVSGPIRRLGGFTNGLSGTPQQGRIDEVGGFSEGIKPPGGSEQTLLAIPLTARQAGNFAITIDAADLDVSEVLLHGDNDPIPAELMRFESLAIQVVPGSGNEQRIDAVDDEYFVQAPATRTFDVLTNDSSPVSSSMTVFQIDNTGLKGTAVVSSDHRRIEYTAPADFTGADVFYYSVVDSRGESDRAKVTVHVESSSVSDKKALFKLVTADLTGRPIASVNEGDDFLLQVRVKDNRADASGVFAAYMDVSFAPSLARTTGPLEFIGEFSNGTAGNRQTPGLIDEAGAFVSRFSPLGAGEYLLFQVPMKATGTGRAVFQTGPADILPDHQSLVFNDNQPMDPAQIDFGRAVLDIQSAAVVVDDSFTLNATNQPVVLDVLANDQANTTSPLTITRLDTTDLRGTVSIGRDGKSLSFTPSGDSRGTEQFHYTAANASGSASATVTLNLLPNAPLDDQVQIRLQATDASGQPLTSVNAGDSFNIQAWVSDVRAGSASARGVYAAYLDLLYEADRASVVLDSNNARGIDLSFGDAFKNGRAGTGATAGILDEVGAFQDASDPTGPGELLLFTAKFTANTGRAAADAVTATEDSTAEFNVLSNDQPNQGAIRFATDPSDDSPESDVLLFDPAQPVTANAIRYLTTTVNVAGGAIKITEVSPSRRGGKVTIINDGQGVRYEPPANYSGPDEFTYSLGTGAHTVVHVDVAGVNDAPQASADNYVAGHQQPLQVKATNGVLVNDSDVDRNALTAQLVTPTAHGQLQLNADGSFTYTPDENFFGTDEFVYRSFDGSLASPSTTVKIEVAPSTVRVRLAATSPSGQPLSEIPAGETIVLKAFAQDMRDGTQSDRGVGAVYFDLTFDQNIAQPQPNATNPLGFDITFGEKYQNVRKGNVSTPGLINDVGALQSSLSPIGSGEFEVFSIPFRSQGPKVADDTYRVSGRSKVNIFDVLANEQGQVFPAEFRSNPSGNSPHGDIVLYSPAQAIFGDDVTFGSTVVQVRNSSQLVIETVSSSIAGGAVTMDSQNRGVSYSPPANFVGTDSFTYTVRDEHGQKRTGTVTVQVVESWSNEHQPLDANSDSFVTTNDVLQIINDLNEHGSRKLPQGSVGATFFDVNRDGHATAIDALVLINFLSNTIHGSAEGESQRSTILDSVSDSLRDSRDSEDSLVLLIARDQLDAKAPFRTGCDRLRSLSDSSEWSSRRETSVTASPTVSTRRVPADAEKVSVQQQSCPEFDDFYTSSDDAVESLAVLMAPSR